MNQNALDYIVRAMVYIASQPDSGNASGKDIAAAIGVSQTYLSKILKALVGAGYLTSVTGPRGGFALARPAEKISLLEVMESLEGPIKLRDQCVLGLSECSDKNPCPFHKDWKSHRRTLIQSLQRTSLADAIKDSWPRYHQKA